MCRCTSPPTCALFSATPPRASSEHGPPRRKPERYCPSFLFANDYLVFMSFFLKAHQPAFSYFLHNPPRPPQTPAGFLQVSLSKILGDRHPAFTSTWLASDFRSTLVTSQELRTLEPLPTLFF